LFIDSAFNDWAKVKVQKTPGKTIYTKNVKKGHGTGSKLLRNLS
jgi:hypothetical protein